MSEASSDGAVQVERAWYAIHVRSRHEFVVRDGLVKAGVETFLPVVEQLRQWKDRKKAVLFALFPGYLFVRLGDSVDEKLAVLKTRGVVRFLGQKAFNPEPVPDKQIDALIAAIESKEQLDPYPYLTEGKRVRIVKGALAGVEGILTRREGVHRLVLSVDLLQRSVSLKIDSADVESV